MTPGQAAIGYALVGAFMFIVHDRAKSETVSKTALVLGTILLLFAGICLLGR